jgi:tRNA (guanine-N7-)-methyltransferase
MRLRYIRGSIENIQQHPLIIQHPEAHKGKWQEIFGNTHPIHIEVGMGKGGFILEQAIKNPQINYIGIEKFSTVILRAVEKLETIEPALVNLVMLRFDAWNITDIFDQQEIAMIYLNFSDPWPRGKQAKRRLTHRGYLSKYQQILIKEGQIQFKTDNDSLFEFSLEEIEQSSFVTTKVTRDLHNSDYVVGNVMTEYEKKFVSLGKTINFIELHK